LSDWNFQWITDWSEVWDPAFGGLWRELLDRSATAHVFYEPSLTKAWTNTYREMVTLEPYFVLGRHASGAEALLPLVKMRCGWRGAWLRTVGPVGANEFDYHDPIATDGLGEKDWIGFWSGIDVELCKVADRYDYFVIQGVRASFTGSSDRFMPKGVAPFCDLSKFGSVERLLATRSRNLRHNLRRTDRRLREAGEVRLRIFSASEVEAALAGLADFLQAHESRWRHAYRAPGWYENLIRETLPTGLLHLSAIELEGRAVSWHFGFIHKKRFYCYVSAYDNSLADFSPGQIHLHRLIEEAYRLGATMFDFLRGEEWYKSEWTEMRMQLFGYESLTPGLGTLSKTKLRDLLYQTAKLLRYKRSS